MAIQSKIRWQQKDYVTLGKAVAKFNKKINELNVEEKKLYLPELINYQDIKKEIYTRKELNRILSSLKRFSEKGAEELYTTKAGENITKWERKELGLQARIAKNRLRGELKELGKENEQGYTRIQMGSMRAREIQAQIRNLSSIENKSGYEFNRLRRRIQNIGTQDYQMRKAITYRENYFQMIQSYESFDNYDKLISKLEKIKNPIQFYEFVSQNELLSDITFMYDMNMNIALGGTNEQLSFNKMLESIGIEIE